MATLNQYSTYLAGDDAYSIADHADFKPTGAFTVGAWIKTSTTGATQRILASFCASGNDAGFYFYIRSTNKITLLSAKNTGTTVGTDEQLVAGSTTITDGLWHYVVGTSDGTNLNVYVDGVSDATAVSWANNPVYQATNYVRVGCTFYGAADTQFFNGNLDGVFLINGTALTQAEIATKMYQDLTGTTNLKAYYKFENNANDSSGQSHTLTDISVPVYQNTADSVPFTYYLTSTDNLSSMYFTTDDAISIVDHADLKPTGSFTVGAWFKFSGTGAQTIWGSFNSVSSKYGGIRLTTYNGTVYLASYKNSGQTVDTDFKQVASATTYNDGAWHFAVGTWDGTHLKLYMDGVQTGGDVDWANAPVYCSPNLVEIANDYGNANFFTGNIDEVFLVNGTAWDLATVKSFMATKIPSSQTNLKLLMDFEGVITDGSGNSHDGTLISVPYYSPDSAFDIYDRRSLDLEAGSTQYASITDARQTGLDFSTTFTLEAWVMVESTPGTSEYRTIASKSETGKWAYYFAYIKYSDNSLGLNCYAFNGTSKDNYLAYCTLTLGVWYHVAVTCNTANASATTFEFFVDGVSIGNGNVISNDNIASISNTTAAFEIGSYATNAGTFDGRIDEVRAWNDVRTGTEISANYNKQLVGNEAGLVGYWRLNGNYTDLTSNNNNLTPSGSPVFSRIVPFDGGSVAYDETYTDTITIDDTITKSTTHVVTDTITLVETIAKSLVRTLTTEVVTISDSITKQPNKIISETITIVESFIRSMGKVVTDVITIAESIPKSVGRIIEDVITIADSLTKQTRKILSDTVTIAENIIRSIGKQLTETITIVESIVKAIERILSDSITISDTITKLFNFIWKLPTYIRARADTKPVGMMGEKDKPGIGVARSVDKPERV